MNNQNTTSPLGGTRGGLIIAIDQSTSATKALLFDDNCKLLKQVGVPHKQYYPQPGWVEHNAEEIWQNTIKAIKEVLLSLPTGEGRGGASLSLAITNQRETVVVWNRETGTPIYNAVVWQCMRGQQICEDLKAKGYGPMVKEKSGLLIDPYFAGSGAKWILDNVEGARSLAEAGKLCFGTIDSWLIYKLTGGKVHATDYTNASRTMLFNVHTLDWDDELLDMLTIPRSMMPKPLPCDAIYGEVAEEVAKELFDSLPREGQGGVPIAGVLGDSHGALSGQMCFLEGYGKATYGTGSSVMVNIGEQYAPAPDGLVTSIGFSALGKTFYAFEGNIHCTGATLNWLRDQLELINGPQEVEAIATSVPDNGGVYFVPAFSGLGAPWWNTDAKASITGMTLASKKAHVVRAALESIAYQVTDLIRTMTDKAGITLREIRVDGGPTKNKFLMQMQSDLLQVPVVRSEVEDASAFGALVMNRFALGAWNSFADAEASWEALGATTPLHTSEEMQPTYDGWKKAVKKTISLP